MVEIPAVDPAKMARYPLLGADGVDGTIERSICPPVWPTTNLALLIRAEFLF